MLSHFKARQAARLGLAALTFALGVVSPLAPTSLVMAQSSGNASCNDPGPPDYPIAAGWFYTQEGRGCIIGVGPARRRGYLVQDDPQGAFWTEFRRYGGLDVLGYPVSQRFNYPATNTGRLPLPGLRARHPAVASRNGSRRHGQRVRAVQRAGPRSAARSTGHPSARGRGYHRQLRGRRRTSDGVAVRAAIPGALLLRPCGAPFERAAARRSGRIRQRKSRPGAILGSRRACPSSRS